MRFYQVIEAGHLNAIAFWFDLHLDEDVSITTAPACIGLGGELTAESSGDASASSANPVRTKGRAAMQGSGDGEPKGEQQASEDFTPAEVSAWLLGPSSGMAVRAYF